MYLGDYELLDELGSGAAGTVYRARSADGAVVAIKRLRRPDASTLARFEREKRLLAELGAEQGFVPILTHGDSQGAPWFVMPLLEGGTLRDRLTRGRLPDAETRSLAQRLAGALASAHRRGIVHRDLKPENILFTTPSGAGVALVADLGLAKHFVAERSQSLSTSIAGVLRGTVGYMSPEQMSDAKGVGPATDVFAIGAILFECATGAPAFAGESVLDLISKVSAGDRPGVRELRRDIPKDLERIIERALAPDVARRFADGDALLAALRGKEAAPASSRTRLATGGLIAVLLLAGVAAALIFLTPSRRARALVARALADTAALPSSIALLDRAIELDPALADAYGRRAWLQGIRGQRGRMRADARRALELDPDCASGLTATAMIRLYGADPDGAATAARRSLAIAPRDPSPHVVLADVALRAQDTATADAELALAARLSGNDVDVAVHAALVRVSSGQPARVRGVLDALAIRAPACANVFAARGWASYMCKEPARALSDAARALELDPGSVVALELLAALDTLRGDPRGAIGRMETAIALDPGSPFAWNTIADARIKLGDVDGALAATSKALAIEPNFAAALSNRAVARLGRGETDLAAADAERVTVLDGRIAAAWQTKGAVAMRRHDYEGAVAAFTRGIELAGGNFPSFTNRASSRLKLKDFRGAIEDATRAIALSPVEDFAPWETRAVAHFKLDELGEAIEDFGRALALAPTNAHLLIERATALQRAGKYREAIADVEAALEHGLEEPAATQIREQLPVLRRKAEAER